MVGWRAVVWGVVAACGCGEASSSEPAERVPLTDARRLQPMVEPLREPSYPSLIDPEVRSTLMRKGFGEWEEVAGESPVELGGDDRPARGPKARRLLRFAFLTDLNIVDDESPARAVNADQPTAFSSAFRPHETELCRMADAMVRTLNRVHAQAALQFLLLGGNLIDNAQQNELSWALSILNGAEQVECDSGTDTDLAPDEDDGKDPFQAEGLRMPFYWVTGNHDLLMLGAVAPEGPYAAFAIGERPGPGFARRDFELPGAPATMEPTIADPRRAFLTRTELMRRIAEDGDGHGLSEAQVESGKAFYSFDIEGTPLTFVVLDTAAENGSAEGLLRRGDVDAYVRPMLDEARDRDRWVVLAMHHRASGLSQGLGLINPMVQSDALTPDEWLQVLSEYPNVLFSLAGHERADHVEQLAPGVWELTSAALGNYPHQARIMELWDEDNGYISLEAIYVDLDMRDDPVAEQGRHLGVMDYVSGWNPQFSTGRTEQRNVRVFTRTP